MTESKTCLYCKVVFVRKAEIDYHWNRKKFCCYSCADKFNNEKIKAERLRRYKDEGVFDFID